MARTGRPREFDKQDAVLKALTLFWRQGYEPTSLNQLKEAMGGISPTSFYAAFGSKEGLFREVLTLYRSSHGRVTDVLRDESLSPRQAIETCLRQSARMQTDPSHPPGCLIVLGASNCGPSSGEVVRDLQEERHRNREAIAAQIRRAIAEGELPKDTDTGALVALFNTFLVGLSAAARDGASPEDLEKAIDQIMKTWPPR
ncbi:TetR family transcriptional regulator [Frigidibacter albus]|uniref:TetR family transcriptional regulator n=1 Tax=Frigidibacter albus TaxID=1465486 RepID=A0A6L8VG42_9RHOB|nr:TetR/AcrR family transcriptional regulator [Frigidibacter albus]MZQ89285.1 TetR family transcriptional regulator [Frigidibacter albus]NBE31191.1 TetR family transcriptional regulator [Frigidibacter albus]GGH53400.1 TetR family transcriptional regulator [Frigidibacter albus]